MSRSRTGPESARPQARLRRAVGIVALLFAALAIADVLGQAARPSLLGEAASGETAIQGGASGSVSLPPGFEDEVFSCVGERELNVDEGGRVVGFVRPEESRAAFALIAERLERGGWTAVPSGWATYGSFTKGEGTYRWVFVACVGAGGSTSVVVQYATTEEGS